MRIITRIAPFIMEYGKENELIFDQIPNSAFFDGIVAKFFEVDITVPANSDIWESGLMSSMAATSSFKFDGMRMDLLRMILVLLSTPMYHEAGTSRSNQFCEYLTMAVDRKISKRIFLSLTNLLVCSENLNFLSYYDNILSSSLRPKLQQLALHVLLVLTSATNSEEVPGKSSIYVDLIKEIDQPGEMSILLGKCFFTIPKY